LVGLSAEAPLRLVIPDLRTRPWKDLTVMIRGDNLLDADYETVVGFPGRGRVVLAGLRVGQ
jgi:outer membrane cobalamin receptor